MFHIVLFVVAALLTGFIAGSLVGAVHIPIGSFLNRVLLAMHAGDFAIFPTKMIVIGLLVALTALLGSQLRHRMIQHICCPAALCAA